MDDDIQQEVQNLIYLIRKHDGATARFMADRRRALNRLNKMGLPWPMIGREIGTTTQTAMRWAGKWSRRRR